MFSLILMTWQNELVHLSLSSLILYLWVKPGACFGQSPSECRTQGSNTLAYLVCQRLTKKTSCHWHLLPLFYWQRGGAIVFVPVPVTENIRLGSGPHLSDQEKSFITLTPGVNVIKLFSSLQMMRPNKLECLYLAITFQSSLTFAGNTQSLPKREASERYSN